MDGITLQIKGEDKPRTFDRQDIRFFTPEELFDTEIDNNVLYINSNMVEWARKATPHECREVGGYNAWEATEKDASPKRSKAENMLVRMLLILCFISYPIAFYKIFEWIRYFIG